MLNASDLTTDLVQPRPLLEQVALRVEDIEEAVEVCDLEVHALCQLHQIGLLEDGRAALVRLLVELSDKGLDLPRDAMLRSTLSFWK